MMFDAGLGREPDDTPEQLLGLLSESFADGSLGPETGAAMTTLADDLSRSVGFRAEALDMALRHYTAAKETADERDVAAAAMEFLLATRNAEARLAREMKKYLKTTLRALTGTDFDELERIGEAAVNHPDVLALKDEDSEYDGCIAEISSSGVSRITPLKDGVSVDDEMFFIDRHGRRFETAEDVRAARKDAPEPIGKATIEGIDLDAVAEPERKLDFKGVRDFDGGVE